MSGEHLMRMVTKTLEAAEANWAGTNAGGRHAYMADALVSAQLLQSPETAAELVAFRALELGDLDGRVSASCADPSHPTWLRAKGDPRGCPWCELGKVHDNLTGAHLSLWEEEQAYERLRVALESAKRGRRDLRAELYGEQAQHRTTLEQRNTHAKELLGLRARVSELEQQTQAGGAS
jgi:hypothetical protein